jgi:pilus assembly protein CpaD
MLARDRKDSLIMSRLPTFFAVAALGLTISGCTYNPGRELTATSNPSLYSVHQPVVQRTDFVLDLSTSGDNVPASELQRLDAWFGSIDASYGDRIVIDEPQGYESASVRGDIARVAAAYGLLLSDGAPVLNGAVPPGRVRVIASRATASVPSCPNWTEDALESGSETSSNFGCATNANLAAMIANPDDLIVGQQDGSDLGSAGVAGRAIRIYRDRVPTGTQPLPSTTTSSRGN